MGENPHIGTDQGPKKNPHKLNSDRFPTLQAQEREPDPRYDCFTLRVWVANLLHEKHARPGTLLCTLGRGPWLDRHGHTIEDYCRQWTPADNTFPESLNLLPEEYHWQLNRTQMILQPSGFTSGLRHRNKQDKQFDGAYDLQLESIRESYERADKQPTR